MEAVNDLDEIIRRFDSIFREEISQEDRYEANPVDGTNWRIRNKASREAGEKILSALLVDIYFVNGTVSGIELVTDYERVASYLKEVLKQSFYRQVFKVYTKRLLNDQITLNNFLSKWVLAESSRYLKAKEEDIQFKGEPISSIAHRSASLQDSFSLQFLDEQRGVSTKKEDSVQTVENFQPSQEVSKFVDDKNYVGEPKSSLGMLENKVKASNPNPAYSKVNEIDKRVKMKCSYDFGPNPYTPKQIRFVEYGIDASVKGAEKEAASKVLKALFTLFPEAKGDISQQVSSLKKESKG